MWWVKRLSLLWEESEDGLICCSATNAWLLKYVWSWAWLMSPVNEERYNSEYVCTWLTLFFIRRLKLKHASIGHMHLFLNSAPMWTVVVTNKYYSRRYLRTLGISGSKINHRKITVENTGEYRMVLGIGKQPRILQNSGGPWSILKYPRGFLGILKNTQYAGGY